MRWIAGRRTRVRAQYLLVVAVSALASCQTYEDSVRADLAQYIGRPARVFFEDKALTVTQMYDRPNGQRVYIAPYKLCGYTVIADLRPIDQQFVTSEIVKAC
jgi:hypothetical protein